VNLVRGTTYSIGFWIGFEDPQEDLCFECALPLDASTISINGVEQFAAGETLMSGSYQFVGGSYIATASGPTVVSFLLDANDGDKGFGFSFDDFEVLAPNVVPEPETFITAGLSLASLLAYGRRRRAKSVDNNAL
jgi:hypothetical protein